MSKELFRIGRWKIHFFDLFMWALIVGVGYLSYYVNQQRVISGFFTSDKWIFVDGLMYTILSALIVGYAISEILSFKKKM